MRYWPGRHTPPRSFRVTAVISVRNDAAYLDTCFAHMFENGVDAYVVDNDCDDETRAIVDRWRGRVVVGSERLPHPGYFDWTAIITRKEEVANRLDSDWILMWDTDELRQPPPGFATLRDAFWAVQRAGDNLVNFDEYVFLPVSSEEDYTDGFYGTDLKTYYYFAPREHHRLSAWRRQQGPVDLVSHAGHIVMFADQSVSPLRFVLRHYLFLSEAHGRAKYLGRSYSAEDLEKGWSKERSQTTAESFGLPDPAFMKTYDGKWDRSDPKSQHPSFVY